MRTKTLKDLIWESVYYGEGFHRIADCSVKITNLRRLKTMAKATVTVNYWGDNHTERTDKVEFPYNVLYSYHMTRLGTAATAR